MKFGVLNRLQQLQKTFKNNDIIKYDFITALLTEPP